MLRGFRLSPKAYVQKFRMMKRYGDDSYSQFCHKLKDVRNYYLESKQITEFQSLCDDILFERFRSVLPSVVSVFVDQRNVSSATEIAKLADLFYESNRDGNINVYAIRNCNYRGNQCFKPNNFSMPNVNSESSKNGVNTVSGDKNAVASQIRCFHYKMPNHKRSECPKLQP